RMTHPCHPTPPPPHMLASLSLNSHPHHPALPSFPTRRSSDLRLAVPGNAGPVGLDHLGIGEDRSKQGSVLTDGDNLPGLVSPELDRKSTRLNSSHVSISYAVFCLKKKRITVEVYVADVYTGGI